jgi:hypothetical protein
MKNINFKTTFLSALAFVLFTGCTEEADFAIPKVIPVYFSEDFKVIDYNQDFDYINWTNFAEAGSKIWIEREYNDDGYAQFSSYQSGDDSNIGWLITPSIDLSNAVNPTFSFTSASNFVNSADNKLEVFVSTNYDGTNVLAATWTKIDAVVADSTTNGYVYLPSGDIDMSSYIGTKINIAFRVTGNSTDKAGLFQVDKVKVYTLN